MTCIVGIEHSGKVVIGADSAGVAGYSITVRADEKAFVAGEFAFGFAGSFRGGQLLRYNLSIPTFPENVDLDRFMATSFIDAVRNAFKTGGHATTNNGQDSSRCAFLVGVRGRLYLVGTDFQVGRSAHGYNAVGAGDDLATGALFATTAMKDPRARATRALEAAAEFSGAVVPPFNIVETP